MMNPNRTFELIKPFLALVLVLFVIHLLYNFIMDDNDDNDFSITITYDCHAVLENRNYYSGQIIDMCEELRRSL